jgi:hypothetical protein
MSRLYNMLNPCILVEAQARGGGRGTPNKATTGADATDQRATGEGTRNQRVTGEKPYLAAEAG